MGSRKPVVGDPVANTRWTLLNVSLAHRTRVVPRFLGRDVLETALASRGQHISAGARRASALSALADLVTTALVAQIVRTARITVKRTSSVFTVPVPSHHAFQSACGAELGASFRGKSSPSSIPACAREHRRAFEVPTHMVIPRRFVVGPLLGGEIACSPVCALGREATAE